MKLNAEQSGMVCNSGEYTKWFCFDEYTIISEEGEVYSRILSKMEKVLIECVLRRSLGNQLAAARILGINRNTLHAKIKKLNIDVNQFKL